ncbi:MAG: PAS domain S-box protein [Chloroflexi bacterium]|nr:PAS domain S-box protein [Chloroflexota bacterium]
MSKFSLDRLSTRFRFVARAGRWLIEPAPVIRDLEQRWRMRLLSIVLLLSATLAFLLIVGDFSRFGLFSPQALVGTETPLIDGIVLIALVMAYILNRTRYYRLAPMLAVGTGFTWSFISALVFPQHALAFATLFVNVLVSSLLFSWRGIGAVFFISLAGALALPIVSPSWSWYAVFEELYETTAAGLVILITAWTRDRRLKEIDRQAQAVARSNAFITALSQVAARIAAPHDPAQMLEMVGRELAQLDLRFSINRLDQAAGVFVEHYLSLDPALIDQAEQVLGQKLRGLRVPLDCWPNTEILRTQRPFITYDTARVASSLLGGEIPPWAMEKLDQLFGASKNTLLVYLPLVSDERVIGTMMVWSRSLREEDVPALWTLANQVAIALEKARLIVAEQAQVAELVRTGERLQRELAAHQQTAVAFEESEQRYRQLVERAPDLIAVHCEGKFVYINPAGAQLFGATSERQIVGMPIMDVVPEPFQPIVRERVRLIQEQGQQSPLIEMPLRRLDGEFIYVETTGIPIKHAGKPATQVIMRDITERKRIEETLRRHALVFENMHDGVLMMDAQGRILDLNPSAEHIFGFSKTDVLGRSATRLTSAQIADAPFAAVVGDALKNFGRWSGEVAFARADGTSGIGGVSIVALKEAEGKPNMLIGIIRDITERKQMEQEIQTQRDFALQVMNTMGQGLTVTGADGRFEYINAAYAHMVGREPQDLIGKQPMDLAEPPDQAILAQQRAYRQQGKTSSYETWLKHANGTLVPVLITGAPRWQAGNVSGAIAVITDLTERQYAEQALRMSEEKYRAIVEDQTELLCRWLPNGTLTFVNGAYCRYFGKTRAELVGHSFMPLIPEEDRDNVQQQFSLLSVTHPVITIEHRVIFPSGEIRWQQWTNHLIADQHGNVVEYQSVGRDITERKLADEARLAAERKFHSLVEQSSDGVVLVDDHGIVVEWNQSQERIYGLEREQVVGKPIWDIQHQVMLPERRTDDAYRRFKEMIERILVAGQAPWFHQTFEIQVQSITGEQRTVESVYFPIETHQGYWLGSLARDITERKRAELALRESNEKYRSLVESMDSVVAVVDMQGQFLYVNELGARQLGFDPPSIVGKNMFDLFPESVAALQVQAVQGVLASDKGIVIESPTIVQGEEHWHRTSIQPIHDERGRPLQALVNTMDISKIREAQKTLEEINRILELRVAERTAELQAANRTLRESEEKFGLIAETIDEVFWMSDLQGKQIFYVSPAYKHVWGRTLASLYENPGSFIEAIYPEDRERVTANLTVRLTSQPFDHEYRIVRPDGTLRWIWERGFPARPQSNHELLYVGVAQDITARKLAEATVEQSLREKEALLKEVHHRVKNNLQVISSMLNLQAGSVSNPEFVNIVQNSQSRIDSIALIHEKLYRSFDLSRIDFRDYLDDLSTSLYSMYYPAAGVRLEKDLPEIYFGIDTAIPLGLIVNEIMSNSLKYAFRNSDQLDRRIYLSLQVKPDGAYTLVIGDNGVGLPAGLDYRQSPSLGLQLVLTLVEQLGGVIELRGEGGTEYQITFREVKYKPR